MHADRQKREEEKRAEIELLNADPFDMEAQVILPVAVASQMS